MHMEIGLGQEEKRDNFECYHHRKCCVHPIMENRSKSELKQQCMLAGVFVRSSDGVPGVVWS